MGCSSSKKKEKKDNPKGNTVGLQQNDEDIRDKYDLGKILGSGSFGQVREAIMKENPKEIRAVKMIERDNEDGEWSNQAIFVREVGLLQQIKHENIIRYYDFYEDLHFLYVVMELCNGGEVFEKIVELKRFSEKNAAVLGQQMLMPIDYIHKLFIAHRDIKAENFMFSEPSLTSPVKMIDFGMACTFEEGKHLTELCGSPHYLAPELIGQRYNQRADVWAFGVLLYLIMYGHYPYDAKHPRDIMVKILTEPIRWQTKVKLSQNGMDYLKRLLEHDPKKRLTAAEALEHPWMKLAKKQDNSQDTTDVLPTEVIRSAHKKVTATRKQVDPKIDEVRNQKFQKLNEDFSKGIRHGQRLGETPKEEFMSKPEFVRRENKITTAPSREIANRRTSLKKLIDNMQSGGNTVTKNDQKPAGAGDAGQNCAAGGDAFGPDRRKQRSASMSAPRRLSYIGHLSGQEEQGLASLYEEKRAKRPPVLDAVPEPPTEIPGASPNDEDVEMLPVLPLA